MECFIGLSWNGPQNDPIRISHRETMGVGEVMGAILRATWGWEVSKMFDHGMAWLGAHMYSKNSSPYDCHKYRIMFP